MFLRIEEKDKGGFVISSYNDDASSLVTAPPLIKIPLCSLSKMWFNHLSGMVPHVGSLFLCHLEYGPTYGIYNVL